MTTSTPTLKFRTTGPQTRAAGPYVIQTYGEPGERHIEGRTLFYGSEVIASSTKVYELVDAAQTHWASRGCPALEEVEAGPGEPALPEETDGEVLARIQERFRVMSKLVARTIEGKIRSLIISGPGGVGKSFPTKAQLRESGVNYVEVTGSMSAIGLYKSLWTIRDGGVLLVDDADSVFENVEALNLLKAALDSSKHRVISWLKNSSWMEEDGIDNQFEFNGQVIFISNIDFEGEVEKGHKRAPHLEALLSRSLYLDLEMSTTRDLLIRIEDMVCCKDMLGQKGIDAQQAHEIVAFMKQHAAMFRSLTLREASKLADLVNADPEDWRAMAKATLSKRRR